MTSQFEEFLVNPYVVGFIIPLLLLVVSSFIKKIVRGSTWKNEDFFLGIELVLAAITSNLVYFYDVTKSMSKTSTSEFVALAFLAKKLSASTSFVCVTFFLLFVVISIHQEWQQSSNSKGRMLRLGFVCNILGFSLLFFFIAFVKGV